MKELVVSWAKGPSGGDINLAHFRKHVRSLVDEPDVAVIDEMFYRLDSDHGGTLDVPELTKAMKALQDAATQNEIDSNQREWRRSKLLQQAEKAYLVGSETAAAEQADRKLEQMQHRKPIGVRIGELLFRHQMRVDEVRVRPLASRLLMQPNAYSAFRRPCLYLAFGCVLSSEKSRSRLHRCVSVGQQVGIHRQPDHP